MVDEAWGITMKDALSGAVGGSVLKSVHWYWRTYITKEARETLLGMHFAPLNLNRKINIEGQQDSLSHIGDLSQIQMFPIGSFINLM